jgi:hypothetical protein
MLKHKTKQYAKQRAIHQPKDKNEQKKYKLTRKKIKH